MLLLDRLQARVRVRVEVKVRASCERVRISLSIKSFATSPTSGTRSGSPKTCL